MRFTRRAAGAAAVTLVAASGAGLVGVGVSGIAGLDGDLAAAREQHRQAVTEQRLRDARDGRHGGDCPWRESRQSSTQKT